MRVERSSLDQVKKRFEINKKKMEEKKKTYDLESRVKELKEEVRLLTIISILLQTLYFLLKNYNRVLIDPDNLAMKFTILH